MNRAMTAAKLSPEPIDRETFDLAVAGGALVFAADERPVFYWRIPLPGAGAELFLSHDDYHLEPSGSPLCGGWVVGINRWVFCVRAGEIAWRVPLPYVFYAVIAEYTDGFLLQHEIGFMKIGCDGAVLLDAFTGLISSYAIVDGVLEYRTLEGEAGAIVLDR